MKIINFHAKPVHFCENLILQDTPKYEPLNILRQDFTTTFCLKTL
jgi:hypothetical protein